MATQFDDPIDLREQLARIDRMRANSDKLLCGYAEAALRKQGGVVRRHLSGLIAIAALLGAGAAIGKLFFS